MVEGSKSRLEVAKGTYYTKDFVTFLKRITWILTPKQNSREKVIT